MLMAKLGKLTLEMEAILETGEISKGNLIKKIANGIITIIPNRGHFKPIALGDGLRSKILCNLGTSTDFFDINKVIKIAQIAVKYGASIICDQSSGPNLSINRKRLLNAIKLPLASIPLYQNTEESLRVNGDPLSFNSRDVIEIFREQVEHGISAPGFHPVSKELIQRIDTSNRVIPYVSRGGTILSTWIKRTGEENPYLTYFDEILEICIQNDIPLTFVCATRSGCLADGYDDIQKLEWKMIGILIEKAHNNNVSTIVDGVGHLRIDRIPIAINTLKKMTHNVPIGVMGPATTDRALGYEHIAHAIGAAVAIQHGANYSQACCRTEHIGLPELSDVIESLGAYKIATYVGDLSRFQHLENLDREMSIARCKNQWGYQLDLAIEPIKARETFERVGQKNSKTEGCSICGKLCSFIIEKIDGVSSKNDE